MKSKKPDAKRKPRRQKIFNCAFITSYERDKETDLDFGQARYYSNKYGRYYSVDPENYGADEIDPQSWNGYSYSRNNPQTLTDHTGLDVDYCDIGGSCVNITSELANQYLFNKDYQSSLGNTVHNGTVRDSKGNVIATYVNHNQVKQMAQGAGPSLDIWGPIINKFWEYEQWLIIPGAGEGGAVTGVLSQAAETEAANIAARQVATKVAEETAKEVLPKLCFVAGTLILTENGLKPIEEIKAGDKVLSYNEKTKRNEYKTVVQTIVREAQAGQLLSVQVEGEAEPLGVTNTHPFYTRVHKARDNTSAEDDEGEWIEAGKLQIGDEIRTAGGNWSEVQSITQQAKGATVYNFTVEDNHDYFVGQSSLLAHNTVCLTAKGKQAIGTLLNHADELVRDVQKARGGKAGAWNAIKAVGKDGVDYSRMTLGEVANAAAEGVQEAIDVLKQVKDAGRLGKKY